MMACNFRFSSVFLWTGRDSFASSSRVLKLKACHAWMRKAFYFFKPKVQDACPSILTYLAPAGMETFQDEFASQALWCTLESQHWGGWESLSCPNWLSIAVLITMTKSRKRNGRNAVLDLSKGAGNLNINCGKERKSDFAGFFLIFFNQGYNFWPWSLCYGYLRELLLWGKQYELRNCSQGWREEALKQTGKSMNRGYYRVESTNVKYSANFLDTF